MDTNFDIFKHLPTRPSSDDHRDTEFDFRAMLDIDHTRPDGSKTVAHVLFPPTQLRTVDNKADFNRLLNKQLSHLKAQGDKVLHVTVTQGGKKAFDFAVV